MQSTIYRIFQRSTILLIFFLINTMITLAQGDLLVTPRRIVFEGNKQTQEITLANTGSDTAKYNISFVQYRMTESGSFEEITEPDSGQYFADKYLRIFPRNVVLGPNESQVIRMQFRKMPNMQEAEYRSHLYFRAVPDEKPLGEEAVDTASIGIRLIPIFGITIPVIARTGNLNCTVELSDLLLEQQIENGENSGDAQSIKHSGAKHDPSLHQEPRLNITFNRTGDKSVFGDVLVKWVSPEGNEVEVGVVRGIAVYTPNTTRKFVMKLRQLPEVDYSKGNLIITYQAPSDLNKEIYATAELSLK
jgi:hypothetical protein